MYRPLRSWFRGIVTESSAGPGCRSTSSRPDVSVKTSMPSSERDEAERLEPARVDRRREPELDRQRVALEEDVRRLALVVDEPDPVEEHLLARLLRHAVAELRVGEVGETRPSRDRVAGEIVGDDLRRVAQLAHASLVEPEAAVGERRDRRHVVADEQHRPPCARDLAHLAEALALERRVADREHLVDDQDLRLQVRGDGEREAQLHAARVALDGRVDEPLDLGELDDLVELALDLPPLHAEDRAVEEDVLAARQLGMEARADLEQRADAAPHARLAGVGSVMRERIFRSVVLPAPLRPMIPTTSPRGTSKLTSAERGELFPVRASSAPRQVQRRARAANDRVAQAAVEDVALAQPVGLAQVTDGERQVRRCLQRRAPAA